MWNRDSILTSGALLGFWRSRGQPPETADAASCSVANNTDSRSPPEGGVTKSDALVDQLLADGRYALLLRPQISETLEPQHRRRASDALSQCMSEVPAGEVLVQPWTSNTADSSTEIPTLQVRVERLFLDRYAVTNSQFKKFVDCGGYLQSAFWHANIWPRVAELVDSTGQAGPQWWSKGCFADGCADHPVVGVSWFEAEAFASWVGKRLPSDAEWVKAASWPVGTEDCPPVQRRYPWGDTMDNEKANLWRSGVGRTTAVQDFAEGVSVGGIHQMVGNVWEWTDSNFQLWIDGAQAELEQPLKSLRGASFDTYFDCHADCQAQSADSPLARKHNVGFRCAISACDVVHQ